MGQKTSTTSTASSSLTEEQTDGGIRNKDSKILIIGGGGTIGSSTALHLLRRGFKNVHIIDVYQLPSEQSAGNDLNKIAGADNIGSFGGTSDSAWDTWTSDPLFSPHAHEVGKLDLTTPEDAATTQRLRNKYEKLISRGRKDVQWLDNEEDIRRVAPHLRDANITGWRGLYISSGGWVAARDAINSIGEELQRLGVQSTFGPSGTFSSLLLSKDGKRCRGVQAVDGTEYEADLVVLAAGAWSPALIDLEGQCVSKAWVYAHIQLTQEEADAMRGVPTMYNNKYGFFFEPRKETNLLKLCNEFSGYTNYVQHQPFGSSSPLRISIPRSHASNPTDTIPTESLDDIKRLIEICLPHLKGRELINQTMCWCTDTDNAQWLLCPHPKFDGLICATGDSGHTFKMLPLVGKYVADLNEGKLAQEYKYLWRWRPGAGDPLGTGRGGPPPKDLSEVDGWKHD